MYMYMYIHMYMYMYVYMYMYMYMYMYIHMYMYMYMYVCVCVCVRVCVCIQTKRGRSPAPRMREWAPAVVQLLIAANADLDFAEFLKRNVALHDAAAKGHETIVRMLVDAKAQVDVCNEAGVTPAAAARAAGHAHLEVLEPACSSSAALSSLSAGRLFWRSSWGGVISPSA